MVNCSRLAKSIEAWLAELDVVSNTSVIRDGVIEVRLVDTSKQDISDILPKPVGTTHINVAFRPKPKTKKEKPKKILYSNLEQSDSDALFNLSKSFDFLTKHKSDLCTSWNRTCQVVTMIARGQLNTVEWDTSWLTRETNKGGGPTLVDYLYGDIPAIVKSIESALQYVEFRINNGGYSWPPKKTKRPLADFLLTITSTGKARSPYLEALYVCNRVHNIQSSLPTDIVNVVHNTINDSPFLSSLPSDRLGRLWQGVVSYLKWYSDNKSAIIDISDSSRVRFADRLQAVCMVYEWNKSTNGRALSIDYIHPQNQNWQQFLKFCEKQYGVNLYAI